MLMKKGGSGYVDLNVAPIEAGAHHDIDLRPINKKSNQPAHLLVRAKILEHIQTGSWSTGTQIPAEPILASQLGVSRMTANKAILKLVDDGVLSRRKGHGTFVLERPKASPTTYVLLVKEDPQTIWTDHYYGSLFMAIQGLAASKNTALATLPIHLAKSTQLEAMGATGFIAINPSVTDVPLLNEIYEDGYLGVVLGSSWDGLLCPSVDSDNTLGVCLAVQHLAELGHQRIRFFGAAPKDRNTIDRVKGYRIACQLYGIALHEPLISPSAGAIDESVVQEFRALLTRKDRPTAIVAGGATLALTLLGVAGQMGVTMPQELSIVGYDDPPFLAHSYPALTTVAQPLVQMATHAAQLIRGGLPSQSTIFPPQLVLRESTSFPPLSIL
jgi:DNA-binding LacI/PurR family transcriptional regulator